MKDRRRIFIGGDVYGAGNIGDDAIVQGIVKALAVLGETHITVGTMNGQPLQHLDREIRYVCSLDMKQVRRALRSCDCFICGGGTVADNVSLHFPLAYYTRLVSLARLYGKRVWVYGVGVNKLGVEGRKLAQVMLSQSHLVTTRDEESLAECLLLGVNHDRLVATSDPAFLVEAEETARSRQLKERLRKRGRLLGVNVINSFWLDERRYKVAIASACDRLHAEYCLTPIFFCNETRPGKMFDYEANCETAALLTCAHEILQPVNYSPGEMIDIISGFDCVLSMRMHSLIFSAIAGVPFITISWGDKFDNHMRMFRARPSGNVCSVQADDLVRDVAHLFANRAGFLSEVRETVRELREKGAVSVAELDKVFGGQELSITVKGRLLSLRHGLWPTVFNAVQQRIGTQSYRLKR